MLYFILPYASRQVARSFAEGRLFLAGPGAEEPPGAVVPGPAPLRRVGPAAVSPRRGAVPGRRYTAGRGASACREWSGSAWSRS